MRWKLAIPGAFLALGEQAALPPPLKYPALEQSLAHAQVAHAEREKALNEVKLDDYVESEPTTKPKFDARVFRPMHNVVLTFRDDYVEGAKTYDWTLWEPYALQPLKSLGIPFEAMEARYEDRVLDPKLSPSKQGVPDHARIRLRITNPEKHQVTVVPTRRTDGQSWFKFKLGARNEKPHFTTGQLPPLPPPPPALQLAPAWPMNDTGLVFSGVADAHTATRVVPVPVTKRGKRVPPARNNTITVRDKNVVEEYLGGNFCDMVVFGPDICAPDDAELHSTMVRYLNTRTLTLLITVFIFFLILIAVKASSKGLRALLMRRNAEDKYMLRLMKQTYTSVACLGLASALVKLVMSWDVFQHTLEHYLFDYFFDLLRIPVLEGEIMNALTFVFVGRADDFLILFACFALLFTALVYTQFRTIRIADTADMLDTLADFKDSIVTYYIARYEFKDRASRFMLTGLDHQFCWFMEYYHACLLMTAGKIVNFSITNLAICFFCVIGVYPFYDYYLMDSIRVVLLFSLVGPTLLGLVLLKCLYVKHHLMPQDRRQYLEMRYKLDTGDMETEGDAFLDALAACMPLYKRRPVPRRITRAHPRTGRERHNWRVVQRWYEFIWGTLRPNRYDGLFLFRKRGPALLGRLAQLSYMLTLGVCSFVLEQLDSNARLWVMDYGPWPLLVVTTIVGFHFALIPYTVNTLCLITYTGMSVREDIMLDTIQTARAIFVKRLKWFVDSLRSRLMLDKLYRGGYGRLPELEKKVTSDLRREDPATTRQKDALWDSLTYDTDGVFDSAVLYSFFSFEGINLSSKAQVEEWLRLFKCETINRAQFEILVTCVSDMMSNDGLTVKNLTRYLVQDLRMPRELYPEDITALVHGLGIGSEWGDDADSNRFIGFLSGNPHTSTILLHEFIDAVIDLDRGTLNALTTTAEEMKSGNWSAAASSAPDD